MWQQDDPDERAPLERPRLEARPRVPPDTLKRAHKHVNDLVELFFGDPNQLERRIEQYLGLLYVTYSLLRGPDDPSLPELNFKQDRQAMITVLNKEHDENDTCYSMQFQLIRMGHISSDSNEEFETFLKRFEAYAQNDPQYHAWARGNIKRPVSQ
jgi:hypothetical protein